MIERIPTNIPGLDELIEGGIPIGFQILVAGEAGAGKTIFSCQLAYNKAKEGLKTYYMTIEESEKSIIRSMLRFSWGKEFEGFIKSGLIFIERVIPLSIDEITRKVLSVYDRYKFNFFVLDTLTAAAMGWKEIQDLPKLRRNIFSLLDLLRQYGVTSLLLSEVEGGKIYKYGFEGYLVDGVIVLRYLEFIATGIPRAIQILKMRATQHATNVCSMEITKDGIKIQKT